jgi:cysteinyl-tRNA synthetase
LVRLTNTLLEQSNANAETLHAVDELFGRLGGDVLGIVKEEYSQTGTADYELMGKLVSALIEQRNDARKKKDFDKADGLRTILDEAGIVLEDKPDGTTWRMR